MSMRLAIADWRPLTMLDALSSISHNGFYGGNARIEFCAQGRRNIGTTENVGSDLVYQILACLECIYRFNPFDQHISATHCRLHFGQEFIYVPFVVLCTHDGFRYFCRM